MEEIKNMTNVKKETRKAYKKLYKAMVKYYDTVQSEEGDKAMRHTPTEAEEAAFKKFRKTVFNTEKFVLIDLATMLEMVEEQPEDLEKRFKQRKQYRTESVTHAAIVKEIMETEDLLEKFEKGLELFNKHNIII